MVLTTYKYTSCVIALYSFFGVVLFLVEKVILCCPVLKPQMTGGLTRVGLRIVNLSNPTKVRHEPMDPTVSGPPMSSETKSSLDSFKKNEIRIKEV